MGSDPMYGEELLWRGFYQRFPFGSELVRLRGTWPEPDGSVVFGTRFPVATIEEYARQADRNEEATEGIFGCLTGEFWAFGPGMTAALVPRLRPWLLVISER